MIEKRERERGGPLKKTKGWKKTSPERKKGIAEHNAGEEVRTLQIPGKPHRSSWREGDQIIDFIEMSRKVQYA